MLLRASKRGSCGEQGSPTSDETWQYKRQIKLQKVQLSEWMCLGVIIA